METMNMDKEQTHWPAGYRINARMERLPTDIVAAFRNMPVAAIGDAMSRNVGSIGLRQYHRRLEAVLCGTAVTVRVRPGDNLMIHKALMIEERSEERRGGKECVSCGKTWG